MWCNICVFEELLGFDPLFVAALPYGGTPLKLIRVFGFVPGIVPEALDFEKESAILNKLVGGVLFISSYVYYISGVVE